MSKLLSPTNIASAITLRNVISISGDVYRMYKEKPNQLDLSEALRIIVPRTLGSLVEAFLTYHFVKRFGVSKYLIGAILSTIVMILIALSMMYLFKMARLS